MCDFILEHLLIARAPCPVLADNMLIIMFVVFPVARQLKELMDAF